MSGSSCEHALWFREKEGAKLVSYSRAKRGHLEGQVHYSDTISTNFWPLSLSATQKCFHFNGENFNQYLAISPHQLCPHVRPFCWTGSVQLSQKDANYGTHLSVRKISYIKTSLSLRSISVPWVEIELLCPGFLYLRAWWLPTVSSLLVPGTFGACVLSGVETTHL